VRYLEIVDFVVGDRVKFGAYEIWERGGEETSPQFSSLYADKDTDDGPPIHARDDHLDDLDVTIVEADLDRNEDYEVFVNLRGHHDLFLTHHSIA
jgi:hypothetical protein